MFGAGFCHPRLSFWRQEVEAWPELPHCILAGFDSRPDWCIADGTDAGRS
jgi:hypothetical protein